MSREMRETHHNWLGSIPKDWQLRAVKNFYPNMTTGFTPPSKQEELYDPDGDVWVNISDLNGSYVSDSKKHINHDYAISKHKNELTPQGSLMYAFKLSVGQVAFASCDLYTNEAIASFHPDKNAYLDFLKYSSSLIVNNAEKNIYGANLLNQERIRNALIVYPPITEQQQIVHFLDRKCTAIDTAIEKTKKSIEKLEEYKKAVITKAVTKGIDPNAKMKDSGVEWIGEIPERWKVTKTKYLFRILKRIAGCEGFDVISITQKGLKIKDITSNEGQVAENYSNYQFVFPGDFAMNHMDLLTGWVDLSSLTGVTSPDYRVFHKINESVNDDYYKYVFQSLYFNKVYYGLAQGVAEVGRKRLQAPAFKELKLPCPPADEPAKIAAYIKNKCMAIDALIEKKQTAINKWEEYKKSLIYYAVTGKYDCRNEVI